MKNKILNWNHSDTVSLLVKSLKQERISVCSTDTVLGLLANTSQLGFEGLNRAKNRIEKSYIILIDSLHKLPLFAQVDLENINLIKLVNNIWPGPATLIFKSQKNAQCHLKSYNDTVALRMPDHCGLLKLLTFFEGLFSTSANLSGQSLPETILQLDVNIASLADYIVIDNDENYRYPNIPSTIIDCTQNKLKIIREGAISIDKIESIYGSNIDK